MALTYSSWRGLVLVAVMASISLCSPAYGISYEDVTFVIGIQGDPAEDCGVRGTDNRKFQSSQPTRRPSWNARACILPFPGNLANARVLQMFPSDRCTRLLNSPNRVVDASGHRLTVRVVLNPTTHYRYCVIVDGYPPKGSQHHGTTGNALFRPQR